MQRRVIDLGHDRQSPFCGDRELVVRSCPFGQATLIVLYKFVNSGTVNGMTSDDKDALTLADRLKQEQQRRGLTDRQVAEEIGASQQTYSTWKSGRTPRAGSHQAIARFLRMKVGKMRTLAAAKPAVATQDEFKLDAIGDSILITRRGGGAVLIENDETGFRITTNPRRN